MPNKPDHDTVRKALYTALDALKPYLSHIVIVGGWVPQIYAWAEKHEGVTIYSYDVDVAVAGSVPLMGSKTISERLQAAGFEVHMTDAGFAMTAFGAKEPTSITKFFYKKGRLQIPVEIIAPLKGRGDEVRRTVQRGLVVEALRFTEILVEHTRKITIDGETLDGKKHAFTFRVPTLAALVFAKGLIFPRRQDVDKKGKDLAYIFEVIKKPHWRKQVIEDHPEKWYRTFRRNLDEAFKTQGSQGPAWVALQYPNRPADEVRKEASEVFRLLLEGG